MCFFVVAKAVTHLLSLHDHPGEHCWLWHPPLSGGVGVSESVREACERVDV